MTRKFLLKAAKGKLPFYMSEADEFLYFYSPTLKDLRATLRCILAQGYRVPKPATLGKRINDHSGHLKGINPFFKTTMFEIFEIKNPLEVKKEIEFKNSFGFTHNLKVVESAVAIQVNN